MTRSEQASEYHKQGYNCAQAVLLAFVDETGLTREQCVKAAAGLGGGVGQLREICGAVTGMTVALSLVCAELVPTPENKAAIYRRTRLLAERFEQSAGSLRCGELMSMSGRDAPIPPPESRPCDRLIREAVLCLEEALNARNNGT